MKIVPVDVGLDRKIVIAAIVSTRFLREVRDIYSEELLSMDYARKVMQWCLKYFEKFNAAPGKHIQDIFDIEINNKTLEADKADMIKQFLVSISDQLDEEGGESKINVELLLDATLSWFKTRDLEHLKRDIEDSLATAKVEDTEALIRQYRFIERQEVDGYEPLTDESSVDGVFETPSEPLFRFPGAAGQLLDNGMVRDTLLGIMGPEKSGKTFLLTEIAIRACMSKCNTVLFELGDMSRTQIDRRLFSNLCGKPSLSRYVGETIVPILDCWKCQTGECQMSGGRGNIIIRNRNDLSLPEASLGYRPCPQVEVCGECQPTVTKCKMNWSHPMAREDVEKARISLTRHMGPDAKLKFHVLPNNTATMEMLNDTLNKWKAKQGFVPDVICIDYDATMAREKGVKDDREAFNAQWKDARRISQEHHCLVVFATQTNAGGLNKENIGLDNFSGDKRKYSHVSAILAIHGLRDEMHEGLCRVSWALGREEERGLRDQVVMLRHLRINRALVASFWRDSLYKPRLLQKKDMSEEEESQND